MNTLFSADCHFSHANILKYCGRTIFMTKQDKIEYYSRLERDREQERSFIISSESLNKMNKGLIQRWNSRVKKEDIVFHIGDWGFDKKKWESQLNGKVIFIAGNHDNNNKVKTKIQSIVIKMGGHKINLVHNPAHANYNYAINLVGHIHRLWQIKRYTFGARITDCFNVGIDVNNYMPVTYNEIMKKYHKWLNKNDYNIGG